MTSTAVPPSATSHTTQAPAGRPGATPIPAANAIASGTSGMARQRTSVDHRVAVGATGCVRHGHERTQPIELDAPDAADATEVVDRLERAARTARRFSLLERSRCFAAGSR
jgi:hypothetical protein